ncbi:MAG: DUF4349 domain-containing protein [Bacteroidota bacterium]|nr:DUF4349 domain-containing protein [Bacteroidota bacterium]
MKYLILPVLLGLGLAGCSQSAQKETAETAAVSAPNSAATPDVPHHQPAPTEARAESATTRPEAVAHAQAEPGHSVAYQAELNMEVADFDQATDHINALFDRYGAYLGTAHESRIEGQRRQEMTLKVPPAQFIPLVAALGKLGHIETKDIASADITAEMLATAAHLAEQQAADAQLRQELARTTSPTEKVRLESQLRRQSAEAASSQAQLQQFGDRAKWATLQLRYYQVLPLATPAPPMPNFSPQFLTAFYRGWSVILELLVVLTNLWPLLLLAPAAWWGLRRWRQHPVV